MLNHHLGSVHTSYSNQEGAYQKKTNVLVCTNYTKKGHTLAKCWEVEESCEGIIPDLATVQCKKCGTMGHYQNKCKTMNFMELRETSTIIKHNNIKNHKYFTANVTAINELVYEATHYDGNTN